jgi:hypothetical protein
MDLWRALLVLVLVLRVVSLFLVLFEDLLKTQLSLIGPLRTKPTQRSTTSRTKTLLLLPDRYLYSYY